MAESLDRPILSYEALRRRAGDFLRTHHPEGTIPVPVEEIVELRYQEEDRRWLEWQAYAFAGLILVAAEPLRIEYQRAARAATRVGLSLQKAGEVARSYVADWLARRFEVSAQVIEKRLDKDGLWPRSQPPEGESKGW